LGNEYNLASDLPNAMDHLPWVRTDWGTPASRGKEDVLTGEALIVAMKAFGNAVRRLDPIRPITSGHAILRPSAYHQRKELSWKRDTREEHIRELLVMHPEPINMLSTHIYPEALSRRYFARDNVSYADLLAAAMDASRQSGKPLFVGEFGAPEGKGAEQAAEARSQFTQLLQAILDSGVPLAALWVFDYPPQDGEWNVTGDNHFAYRLEMIRDANRALGQSGEKTK
jgi:endo-1,4-beta-mannosidase